MAIIAKTPGHIRYFPVEYDDRQQQKTGRSHASPVPPLLKASLVGGLGLTTLILINLIRMPNGIDRKSWISSINIPNHSRI
jgi:hypothetical protein